jgi:PEP-CTERM motif
MRKATDRSFITRLLRNTALFLALMTASAAGVQAQEIGADGANGADGVNPGDPGLPGGDGESVSGSGTVMGGNGGGGGNAAPADLPIGAGSGGNGGNGGAATATGVDANAVGGNGGGGGSPAAPGFLFGLGGGADLGGNGGNGGNATALATGSSDVSASATGGSGGLEFSQLTGDPGAGGDANATADASARGGGTASANAIATGGLFADFDIPQGAANATSNAEAAKGAIAEAQSSGFGGGSGEYQSTAKTSLAGVSVQSTAMAPSTGPTGIGLLVDPETTIAVAQGGSGQPVPNDLFQTTFAFSTALPDKAYAATLIDGASNVADALLGPDDTVFGIAILVEQGIGDSAESTFDFRFRGDLLLGSIEDDSVTNLGSSAGGIIDLTLSGPGIFVIGGAAVPEPSTWAMMVLGFAGLGFAGYRRARPTRDLAA